MKIIFLGTNGWYDSPTGNTICTLVRCNDFDIILDAGSGIHKLDKYSDGKKKQTYMFLSHFHLDHIVGLHALVKFDFKKGLQIVGMKGTRKALSGIMAPPFSLPLDKLKFDVGISEFAPGRHPRPFPFVCGELVHSSKTYGYRFEIDGKVITYCTDTGYCANAIELANDADVLIAECSLLPGMHYPKWPHLNPEEAARIAKKAGAKQLFLVHFDALRYDTLQKRKIAVKKAHRTFVKTTAALDGMAISFPSD